jgi:hypothetical protein
MTRHQLAHRPFLNFLQLEYFIITNACVSFDEVRFEHFAGTWFKYILPWHRVATLELLALFRKHQHRKRSFHRRVISAEKHPKNRFMCMQHHGRRREPRCFSVMTETSVRTPECDSRPACRVIGDSWSTANKYALSPRANSMQLFLLAPCSD